MSDILADTGMNDDEFEIALAVARVFVKQALRAKGEKISHYSSENITLAATDVLSEVKMREAILEGVRTLLSHKKRGEEQHGRTIPDTPQG
jgi:predicted RNA binding protein with dsRBD fold (UPF0201 family)